MLGINITPKHVVCRRCRKRGALEAAGVYGIGNQKYAIFF